MLLRNLDSQLHTKDWRCTVEFYKQQRIQSKQLNTVDWHCIVVWYRPVDSQGKMENLVDLWGKCQLFLRRT
jgi:hypothetical protein